MPDDAFWKSDDASEAQEKMLLRYLPKAEIPDHKGDASFLIQLIIFIGACVRRRTGSSRNLSNKKTTEVYRRLRKECRLEELNASNGLVCGDDGKEFPAPGNPLADKVDAILDEMRLAKRDRREHGPIHYETPEELAALDSAPSSGRRRASKSRAKKGRVGCLGWLLLAALVYLLAKILSR